MENNAIIMATFEDILEILDARKTVCIFTMDNGKTDNLKYEAKVYEILSDYSFLKRYKNYKVIGLNKTLGSTSILIEEA